MNTASKNGELAVNSVIANDTYNANKPQDNEPVTEKEWREEFQLVLDSLKSTGNFAVGKELTMPALHPKIRVEGMKDERIAFPLTSAQAEEIRAAAGKVPSWPWHGHRC